MLSSAVLVVVLASACGGSGGTSTPGGSASLSGQITVFAASSLTDAFIEEKQAFEAAHTGVTVEFNFAGSPTLVTQLDQGARADVLATADQDNMDAALQKKLVIDAGTIVARNRLTIIVPDDNPAGIRTPFDLARSGLRLVLAQEGVPAGRYARQALDKMEADARGGAGFKAKVLANVVSEAPNVRTVVNAVQLGEADAGIVYVSDVTNAQDVTEIGFDNDLNVIASYPIAVTKDAGHAGVARAFIDFLLSEQGQQILGKHNFLPLS